MRLNQSEDSKSEAFDFTGSQVFEQKPLVNASTENQFEYQEPANIDAAPSFIRREDRVFLSWHNLEYSVPLNKEDRNKVHTQQKLFGNIAKQGNANVVAGIYLSARDKDMKEVLHNCSGYAKPREMIAIMGPSGSGKTSLLNVLAQRFGLAPGSKLYGEVRANNRVVHQNDFGKFGAFVQQDDILIETMTAVEAFTFAGRLRTTLDEKNLKKKIDQLLDRLGLAHCQNTRIGSERLKGLSGGEKKRTSIGYELITDPRLVLLDEPTSGLDSTTALKIMKMIKKEALMGMTVCCTIHQPSSDLFRLMDRVIVLHDGYEIYQGPTLEIMPYLGSMGIKTGRFMNPADFIIKTVQAPQLVRPGLTLNELTHNYDDAIKPKIIEQMETIVKHYDGIEARFSKIARTRQVSTFFQFQEIFKRNLIYLLRNPRTMQALFLNIVVVTLFILILFLDVADPYLAPDYPTNCPPTIIDSKNLIQNIKGLSFLLVNSLMFPAITLVVIQMPLQVPVFERELMNKMYTPTPYLFGRMLSHVMLQIFSPILMTIILFFGLGTSETYKVDGFFGFMICALEVNLIGCFIGYFCGVAFKNSDAARQAGTLFMIVFHLLSGGLSNQAATNAFINKLQYISSNRYAVQLFYTIITFNGSNFGPDCPMDFKQAIDSVGFDTFDYITCYWVLVLFVFLFIGLGWVTIVMKNRRFTHASA